MPPHRAREERRPVRIGARLKSGRGWFDAVIRNVSPSGVMAMCEPAPERGDYVEVRCGTYVIVARVAWTKDDCFGARTQNPIELPDLIAGSEGRARMSEERCKLARARADAPRRPGLGERAAASARFARAFEFLSLACVGVGLAALAAGAAYDALSRPLDAAAEALATGQVK